MASIVIILLNILYYVLFKYQQHSAAAGPSAYLQVQLTTCYTTWYCCSVSPKMDPRTLREQINLCKRHANALQIIGDCDHPIQQIEKQH